MATYRPIVASYQPDDASNFTVLADAEIHASLLLALDESEVASITMLVGDRDCETPGCTEDHRRVEIVLDDMEGHQTVLRFKIRTASLLSALLSRTLADTSVGELSQAVDDVIERGESRTPGDPSCPYCLDTKHAGANLDDPNPCGWC